MNLIEKIKPAPQQSLEKSKKRFLKIPFVLITIIVLAVVGWFGFLKQNKAMATPFGLNNNYIEVMEMNKRLMQVVPIPVSEISTAYQEGDKRVVALLIFLEKYRSPAASLSVARAFVENADKNGFGDKWQLLPAISGVESGFCRLIPYTAQKSSYNCWGWGGPGNWYYFDNFEHAVESISAGLAYGYGVDNLIPEVMVRSYCPPCYESGGYWARGVHQYINEINDIYNLLQ